MNTNNSNRHEYFWCYIKFKPQLKRTRLVEQVEAKLCATLGDQEFNTTQVGTLLQEYRVLCEDLILENFEDPLGANMEDKLWDAHVRINGRFRKRLGYFRNLQGKKKPVEQRKAAKLYLRFLKTSQQFYRGYIQRLAAQFGGIPEITAIAQKFSLDASSTPKETTQTTPELQRALLQSCCRTLVHLGDLSRYRESELDTKGKKKNWCPAIGCYDLAIAINPSSGVPYNQLAIIARFEGNHIRTLYHLYRAHGAYGPPPTTFQNLSLELKKLRDSSKSANLVIDASEPTGNPLISLQRGFPLLHAYCFSGTVSGGYDALEGRVLKDLQNGLKEGNLDTNFVNMVVLSNIAADFAAGDRWQDDPEAVQNENAFKSIQRLNIRTFSTLLQSLGGEYNNRTQERSKITSVVSTVRKLLPGLRYYSAWLVSRAALLSVHLGDSTLDCFVKAFWTIYVDTTSLLLSATVIKDLPRLEYLLEEDVDIIGFRPLQEVQLEQKLSVSEALKRRFEHREVGITRQPPDIEMRCRIRDFIEDAISLSEDDSVPIEFVGAGEDGHFAVVGDWNESPQDRTWLTESSNRSQRLDNESTTDSTTSQEITAPVPLSTAKQQTEDDVPRLDMSSNMAPPLSTSSGSRYSSVQAKYPNETSYAIGDSTLTALDTLRQGQIWAAKEQAILCQQNSNSQSQRVQSVKSTSSEVSEMPDPTQAPTKEKLSRLHPAEQQKALRHYQLPDNFADDFDFNSPNVIPDSSDRIRCIAAVDPTPPNGQG
ncbi:MAG: hypothetical protein Q9213_006187 [Squamulea squamosa]